MKPQPFRYARPETEAELAGLLAEHGDEARILAGGQSLMPMLAMRLAGPAVIADINRLPGLDRITFEGGTLRIGSLVRHHMIAASPLIARHAPMLAQAADHVAHPAIRNRGTLCGSLALADPAAEFPACAVALGATLVLRSRAGERRVAAAEFFRGTYETALLPEEYLAAVLVPVIQPEERHVFLEIARRQGDFAIAGLAARATMRDGRLDDGTLVLFAATDRPMACPQASALLEATASDRIDPAALANLLCENADFHGSHQASAGLKRHLAGVLAKRLLDRLRETARKARP